MRLTNAFTISRLWGNYRISFHRNSTPLNTTTAVYWPRVRRFPRHLHSLCLQSGFPVKPFFRFLAFTTSHEITISPKLIPWFVSDVTPPDFEETIKSLLDPSFLSYTTSPPPSADQQQHLQQLASRLKRYVSESVFSLSVPIETPLGGGSALESLAGFWTTPVPYWDMKTYDPKLWDSLKDSDLVVMKVICPSTILSLDLTRCIMA